MLGSTADYSEAFSSILSFLEDGDKYMRLSILILREMVSKFEGTKGIEYYGRSIRVNEEPSGPSDPSDPSDPSRRVRISYSITPYIRQGDRRVCLRDVKWSSPLLSADELARWQLRSGNVLVRVSPSMLSSLWVGDLICSLIIEVVSEASAAEVLATEASADASCSWTLPSSVGSLTIANGRHRILFDSMERRTIGSILLLGGSLHLVDQVHVDVGSLEYRGASSDSFSSAYGDVTIGKIIVSCIFEKPGVMPPCDSLLVSLDQKMKKGMTQRPSISVSSLLEFKQRIYLHVEKREDTLTTNRYLCFYPFMGISLPPPLFVDAGFITVRSI